MFRPMRRHKQLLSEQETLKIMESGTSGVLAVLGDEDYPYAVPLSYVYIDGRIYFHCAKSGHKLDAISRHPKASFCVIAQDRVMPEEYTSYFRSAIAFGRTRVLTDEEELRSAIVLLADKYHPTASAQEREAAIQREADLLCMFALEVEHLTGKEAIELVRARNPQ